MPRSSTPMGGERERNSRRDRSQVRSRERTVSRSNKKKEKEKDIGVPGAGTHYVYNVEEGRCESPRRKRMSRGTSREPLREKKTWADYTAVSLFRVGGGVLMGSRRRRL